MDSKREMQPRTNILPAKVMKLQNTGRSAFILSKRIAAKYAIFRKSGRFPSLVFLGLFRAVSGEIKTTNIHRTELIRNYFKLYFNLYFDAGLTILNRPGTHHYNQFRMSAANKMFSSKAAFLSFPGLTGESIKALDARLSLPQQVLSRGTSGTARKEIAYALTDDRISRMLKKFLFTEKVVMPAKAGIQTLSPRKRGTRRQEILDARLKISGITEKEFRGNDRRNPQILFQQSVSNYDENRFKPASSDLFHASETLQNTGFDSIQLKKKILQGKHNIFLEKITDKNIRISVVKRAVEILSDTDTSFAGKDIVRYARETSPVSGIHLNSGSMRIWGEPSALNSPTKKLIHKPAVPASGKNLAGSADIISSDKKEIYTVKKPSVDTNNHFKKETVKETSLHEIDTLADRVYRIIEKRIAIEKERIGRF